MTSADVMTFTDKGYQGVRGSVRTPFWAYWVLIGLGGLQFVLAVLVLIWLLVAP